MSDYTEFFLSAPRSAVPLQLLEISHSSFSQTFFKVRNARGGVTVTLEDDSSQLFDYLPMKITQLKVGDDLDTGLSVSMGDLGVVFPAQVDAIDVADAYFEQPVVKYRVYRSDNLDAPLYGPLKLQIKTVTFDRQGITFEATPPRLNYNKTGELYQFDRFPMLRGFL